MVQQPKKQVHLFGGEEENCLCCSVGKGEHPELVVFEDDRSVVFLDKKPLFKGHCLVIPKEHLVGIEDVPAELLLQLFNNTKQVSVAVEKAMGSDGTFIAINNKVSQSIPHLHIHVVPRRPKDGLHGFFWPRTQYANDEEMEEVRSRLQKTLSEVRKGAR